MPSDLVSLNRCLALSFPNITDTSQNTNIQALIGMASRATEKYCKRIFSVQSYDGIYDAEGNGLLILRQYPVIAVNRLSTSPTVVLQITNTDKVTNSRAFVTSQQVAQQDVFAADLLPPTTGLTLTRVASGVPVVVSSITWNLYPTVAQVATAINALGAGWSATAQPGYTNWASADMTPLWGPLGCLGSNANLKAHTVDAQSFDLIPETGEVRFVDPLADVLSSGWMPNNAPATDLIPGLAVPRGNRNVRVQYTAGFNVIPDDVQYAVSLWAAHMFAQPGTAGGITSQTLGDYSYVRETPTRPPKNVETILYQYKDHSKAA